MFEAMSQKKHSSMNTTQQIISIVFLLFWRNALYIKSTLKFFLRRKILYHPETTCTLLCLPLRLIPQHRCHCAKVYGWSSLLVLWRFEASNVSYFPVSAITSEFIYVTLSVPGVSSSTDWCVLIVNILHTIVSVTDSSLILCINFNVAHIDIFTCVLCFIRWCCSFCFPPSAETNTEGNHKHYHKNGPFSTT